MKNLGNGIFTITLYGDKMILEYLYEVIFKDKINITVDLYSKATTVNGKKSVILDIKENETDFISSSTPIIYELIIRDISMFLDSGIKNKGKFLALTEENTKISKG